MEQSPIIVNLIISAGIVIMAVSLIYVADKKTSMSHWSAKRKELVLGIFFGFLAAGILQMGPDIHGTIDNIQDVVPLVAGMVFGAPAGLVAGFSAGGLAVLLGADTSIQWAIGISLCMSGMFAAFLRHVMFNDKTASPFYGLAAGLVYSVFHILILMVSHISDLRVTYKAFSNMTVPLIVTSALVTMAALYVVARIGREKKERNRKSKGIAQTFQRWLLVCILAAFAATCTYSWMLQTELASKNAHDLLRLNLLDLHADILDVSDKNLLWIAHQVAQQITPDCYVNEGGGNGFHNAKLKNLVKTYNVVEINLIDTRGIDVASSEEDYPGFDMASGKQSAEFLPLLHGEKEKVQAYQTISSDQNIARKYAGVALPNGGFVQVGYDAAHFQQSLDEAVNGFTRNKHIGENGGIIICDDDNVIVSDNGGSEGKSLAERGLSIDPGIPVNTGFMATIHGKECLCMYDRVEGYLIITYVPYQEIMLPRDMAGYITAFMEIVLFAAIFLLIYFLVKKLVVDNIHKVNAALALITKGNLDVRVDVHTNDEFTSLSDDINETVDTLKQYIAEAAARIDKELEFARKIQMSALPSVFPPYPDRHEFEIYASMDAAKEVGGDFYDFYLLDKNHLALLIADVSGKGIPAAMFMMTAKTLIKSLAESGAPLSEVFGQANERLCENNEAGMFVTAWMGILDIETGAVEYVNAGHNPPLVGRQGKFSYLKMKPGFVLGGMDGMQYTIQQLQLDKGDTLLLYTDGLTEAMNASGTLFGEKRVLAVLSEQRATTDQVLIDFLKASVRIFVGDAEQSDDITMLALTYKGKNLQ